MAEYNKNDHDNETTGLSAFFANYNYNPRFQANTRPAIRLSDEKANGLATTIQDFQDVLKVEMARVQEIYCETADESDCRHLNSSPVTKYD